PLRRPETGRGHTVVGRGAALYAGLLAYGSGERGGLSRDRQSTFTDHMAGNAAALTAPSVGIVAGLARRCLWDLYSAQHSAPRLGDDDGREAVGFVAGSLDAQWRDHVVAVVVCCGPTQLLVAPGATRIGRRAGCHSGRS